MRYLWNSLSKADKRGIAGVIGFWLLLFLVITFPHTIGRSLEWVLFSVIKCSIVFGISLLIYLVFHGPRRQ